LSGKHTTTTRPVNRTALLAVHASLKSAVPRARDRLTAVLIALLLTACAGSPPVDTGAGSADCPDMSGSYCASGLLWQKGSTELTPAYLPHYLGVPREKWDAVDRVDIEGVTAGLLKLTLRAGERELTQTEISAPVLVCGSGRVALQMDAIPWGGAGAILALGASSGWRLFQRNDDGSLRVEEQRHETGTVFLVMPLYINSAAWLRFSPYADNACDKDK
jgi:hypothetical protein